jgi:hypothetical protein
MYQWAKPAGIKDVQKEFKATHRMGSEIILLIRDFNEDFGSDPDLMASICTHSDLYNVLLADRGHTEQTDNPTYTQGRHGLEYAFISHTLWDQVDGVGHNQYHQFIFLDHCACCLDLADQATLSLLSLIAP